MGSETERRYYYYTRTFDIYKNNNNNKYANETNASPGLSSLGKKIHTHTQSVTLDAPLFRFHENRTDIVLRARTGVCYICVLKQHDENQRFNH